MWCTGPKSEWALAKDLNYGLGMRVLLVWEWDCCWFGNESVTGLGTRLLLVWEWDCYWFGNKTVTGLGMRLLLVWKSVYVEHIDFPHTRRGWTWLSFYKTAPVITRWSWLFQNKSFLSVSMTGLQQLRPLSVKVERVRPLRYELVITSGILISLTMSHTDTHSVVCLDFHLTPHDTKWCRREWVGVSLLV